MRYCLDRLMLANEQYIPCLNIYHDGGALNKEINGDKDKERINEAE